MILRRWQRRTARVLLLTFGTSITACGGGGEQPPATTSTMAAPPTTLPSPTTMPPPTLPTQAPEPMTKQQLRELVAPVALYPDVVLASLLPATTFPDQVHDAAGWVAQNNGQVPAVPEDRQWDGSVAGLLQFPDVLTWLDDNDPWTEQMGQAVTYQQGDVLQAVQDYRQEVMNAGNLQSNQYQKVTKAPDQDIIIEPAQPDTVYVPTYDAAAATQPQAKTGINPWLAFGGGVAVGALGAWALYSIFDDDDDDDYHGGGYHGGHNRKINYHDNVVYRGRPRGRPVPWQARPRQRPYRQDRPDEVFKPKPLEPRYSGKQGQRPGGVAGGVRPPQARPGQKPGQGLGNQRPGQAARPATAQPTPAPTLGAQQGQQGKKGKQGGGQQGGGGKQGGGQGGGGGGGGKKQKQQAQQPAAAPAPTRGGGTKSTTKSSTKSSTKRSCPA